MSSREDENFDHFIRDDGDRDPLVQFVAQEYGLPGQPGSAKFWRQISARTYFDRITEPVLLVHGSSDSTCPPAWARASYRALRAADVDARLAWFPDEHAFGPRSSRRWPARQASSAPSSELSAPRRVERFLGLVAAPPVRQGMPADGGVDGGLCEQPGGVEQRHG